MPESDPQEPLMTAPEVAAYLRTSLRQARKLIRTGEIQGRRPGRSYVVSRGAVDAYMRGEGRTTPS